MATELQQRYRVKGAAFGARGCSSCTCNPCDCNPCNCGDSVSLPLWRVSGYAIESGEINGREVAHLLLLSLSQPAPTGNWQEVILIDDKASHEQAIAALALFEERMDSLPAELGASSKTPKAVYSVPMHYALTEAGPVLRVAFIPERAAQLRGAPFEPLPWHYEGPMALRETFALSSS
ncbi:DUF1326 domain-containing protein [Ktedonosporobacter rubrisoli]|uniref:DUF1326 domain-containing protein n=1 Tax=Ktedonosporobacter rubrisoli TaxID=2509675 RepID=A0A4P6JJP1_KTERU|nr:DUF1326 domain-containing protein [Ktedonosporobacter rubrisoli]QBD75345.1 DUF1326 domain-containing protein [Ktedonosporobacter rubrisoli]